jgi:hypothetical protein
MPDQYQDRYPFRTAALLAEAPAKAARNWMDRGELYFLEEIDKRREGIEWRRFSIFDVMRLAVTRRLVDVGVPVRIASTIAFGMFEAIDIFLLSQGRISKNKFIQRMADRTIFAWRKGDGWDVRQGRAVPPEAAAVFVTVDTSAIVGGVFDRLDALDAGD